MRQRFRCADRGRCVAHCVRPWMRIPLGRARTCSGARASESPSMGCPPVYNQRRCSAGSDEEDTEQHDEPHSTNNATDPSRGVERASPTRSASENRVTQPGGTATRAPVQAANTSGDERHPVDVIGAARSAARLLLGRLLLRRLLRLLLGLDLKLRRRLASSCASGRRTRPALGCGSFWSIWLRRDQQEDGGSRDGEHDDPG